MATDKRHIEGLENVPASAAGCVLTIGNFDGVHVGHRRIIATVRALADDQAVPVVALTFEPPPNIVLRPDDPPRRIVPPDRKVDLLFEAGADWVVTAKTDPDLLALSAEEFIRRIVLARFAPAHVVEGCNFFFGRGRRGNIEVLKAAAGRHGFIVHVVEPVVLEFGAGPQRVSSTLIRDLLSAGRIADANRCLAGEFTLYGCVQPGAGRGEGLGYPTVNLGGCGQIVPGDGVYAGWACVAGREFPAAISVGARPTFGDGPATVEAFLIDADGQYYDQKISIRFSRRLRDQIRFADGQALKAQIAKDVQRVREI